MLMEIQSCVLYLHTETSSSAVNDKFYQVVNELLQGIPLHTILMVTGDLNARIGQDSHETNPTIVCPACKSITPTTMVSE